MRQKHCYQPAHRHDTHASHNGDVHNTAQAVELLTAIVIAGNGLHALIQSHDKHHKHHAQRIGNAIRSNGQISAIAHQLVVHEDDNDAGGSVHQERRDTYTQNQLHQTSLQTIDAPLEMEQLTFVGKELHLPRQRDALGDNSSQGSSPYAPTPPIDEDEVKNYVQAHRHDSSHHRLAWLTRCTQHGIHTEIHVRDDVAQQDDLHESTCIRECMVACTKEAKNGIEEDKADHGEGYTYNKVECHRVAKKLFCRLIITLSKLHRYRSRRTDTYCCTESGAKVHKGKGNGKTGDSHRTHHLTDKHTVDDIVERSCRHCHHCRQCILQQQMPYGFCAQRQCLFLIICFHIIAKVRKIFGVLPFSTYFCKSKQ